MAAVSQHSASRRGRLTPTARSPPGAEPTPPAGSPPAPGTAHLRCHDALPLGDQAALVALAVPPHAEALVPLQRRGVAVVAAAGTLGQPRPLLPRCSGAPVRRGGRHGGRRLPKAARLVPRARDVRGLAEGRGVTGHRGRRGRARRAISSVLPCPVPSGPVPPPRAFWRAAPDGRRPSCRASPTPAPGGPCGCETLATPRERLPFPPRSSSPTRPACGGKGGPRPGRSPSGARRGGGCGAGPARRPEVPRASAGSRCPQVPQDRMPRALVGPLRPLPSLRAPPRPAQAVSEVVMPDEV